MRLVILESPYAGRNEQEINDNVAFARACMRDCLMRDEAPIASHLLYTQAGVLADAIPSQRARGIAAGLEWRKVAEAAVFYVDLGWSRGMTDAKAKYDEEGKPYEVRRLGWTPWLERERMREMERMTDEDLMVYIAGRESGPKIRTY